MSKTALNESQRKLIKLLSLKEALDDINSLFNIGERAAGTPGEFRAVKLIESRFREIGLKNVHLEPFKTVTSNHELSELELLEPIRKKISSGRCFGTKHPGFATSAEGITGAIVDVGFGTLRDFKRMKHEGVNFKGKIVLIEVNEKLFHVGAWAPVAQAQEFEASAAILTSVVFERDILRNYSTPDASIPVISIPYIEAQTIRRLLREEEVKANLKNTVELDVESTSHNVVGELPGHKYPDQIIVLTAHHDSWYGAANDDACGVAVLIGAAEVLATNYKNARTIKFVTCGGEEFTIEPGVEDIFWGLAGSYAYTKQHANELDKIVANINLDGFAYGSSSNITLTPELESLMNKLIEEFEAEAIYEVEGPPDTGLDQWWFVRHGVPSVSINPKMDQYMKIYHSSRDTPELINADLMRNALKMTLALILKLDSPQLLPYDFTSTAKNLRRALSERSAKLEDVIDLGELIDNATNFKVVATRLQKKSSALKQKKLTKEIVSSVNSVQRRTCSSLNPKLVNIKCGITTSAAYVVPAYLDALINLKKAIVAAKRADKETLTTSLKAVTEKLWGLNVSPKVYAVIRKTMLDSKRAQGLKFDLIPEARELDKKSKKKIKDVTIEIAS
ncbi:MAG: M28 family peptidase, partial [Aigarchaeota archaeon]|nr:M28 family peptidase [Aigarchaeota archaeon]